MEQLCEKVAAALVRNGWVSADKKDWVVYILQKQILRCFGVGLFFVLLGWLAGWLNAAAFYIVFSQLRAHAGGWHAPKPWLCFVLSSAVALAVGLLGPLVAPWPDWVHGLAAVLSLALLAVIAPVAPANLPFTPAEHAAHRRVMLGWLAFAAVGFALSSLFGWGDLAVYIALALVCVCVTVIASKLCQPSQSTEQK